MGTNPRLGCNSHTDCALRLDFSAEPWRGRHRWPAAQACKADEAEQVGSPRLPDRKPLARQHLPQFFRQTVDEFVVYRVQRELPRPCHFPQELSLLVVFLNFPPISAWFSR